jgi:hypothetical protein
VPASSIRAAAVLAGLQNTAGVKATSIRPAALKDALLARGLAPNSVRPRALLDATSTLTPNPLEEPSEP